MAVRVLRAMNSVFLSMIEKNLPQVTDVEPEVLMNGLRDMFISNPESLYCLAAIVDRGDKEEIVGFSIAVHAPAVKQVAWMCYWIDERYINGHLPDAFFRKTQAFAENVGALRIILDQERDPLKLAVKFGFYSKTTLYAFTVNEETIIKEPEELDEKQKSTGESNGTVRQQQTESGNDQPVGSAASAGHSVSENPATEVLSGSSDGEYHGETPSSDAVRPGPADGGSDSGVQERTEHDQLVRSDEGNEVGN